ncbi:transglutaminase domain-containing protein [Facklamia sp. DSM 111018]|uniref:Transglutaminase domain-containing protein n=1 Tax=Facklamia lactis TaxID=2749967 RepID=A0ABS0LNL9_9LACT|nr:transglutaminase domain-containing protein [Facklamia lactis]MBG9979603.1 transglutaminase domain-containing protein [Facklamia lactis]MBG9985717.1 transglutaminase domain-containing protein [Facklamia lactis]
MRKILKRLSTLVMGLSLLAPIGSGLAHAEEASSAGESRAGTFTVDFDLSHHEGEEVRLWIPYAQSDDFQEISNIKVTFDEENAKSEITEDDKGNQILYVEWSPEATDRTLTYSFDVERQEVLRPDFKEEEDFDPAEFDEFLQGNSLMPIDGEVKETAESIIEGKTTVKDKAQAIYDWIYDNMERDNDVVGCGLGDVKNLLVDLDGKCTDIHSVFIALARSVGIPARETFGVRLSKDPEADVTTAQHCWAEYYQPGTGWVAIDIADVLKAVLNDELDKDSEEALALKDYYWGNLDPIRVGFSTGRELMLVPEQEAGPINNFGYPYAEVDGKAIDFYKPEEFIYSIQFTEADANSNEAAEEETSAE